MFRVLAIFIFIPIIFCHAGEDLLIKKTDIKTVVKFWAWIKSYEVHQNDDISFISSHIKYEFCTGEIGRLPDTSIPIQIIDLYNTGTFKKNNEPTYLFTKHAFSELQNAIKNNPKKFQTIKTLNTRTKLYGGSLPGKKTFTASWIGVLDEKYPDAFNISIFDQHGNIIENTTSREQFEEIEAKHKEIKSKGRANLIRK